MRHQQECNIIYSGPIRSTQKAERQAPLSSENARRVAIRALGNKGRVRATDHFRKRCNERQITTLDVQQVIRFGGMKSGPELCPEFNNFKYCFRGRVDGLTLEVSFAIDPTQDYADNPLIILISAVWKTTTGAK